jgi:membrane-associated phospholipid phosphatase
MAGLSQISGAVPVSIEFRATSPTPIWQEATRWVQAGLPAFWPRSSRLAWIIIGICALSLAVLCVACRFEYAPVGDVIRIAVIFALACILAGAGWLRTALLLEALALVIATALVVPALSSISASMALPLQDDVLAAIDRWMGIDWTALAFWYRDHPVVTHILFDAYASIAWQPALLIFLLAFLDPERLRRLMTASAITLAVTVVVFFLVPALGPYHYFKLAHAEFPDVTNSAPWTVPPLIEALRAGSHKIVFDGLVTFPSYHAATSIMFAFGWAGVPLVGVPLIALNMVMLVSTVPIGSHYVIDVIAGIAVAYASLRLANMYFSVSDPLPPLETWDRTPAGRRILMVLSGWPVVGTLLRRPLNASNREQSAAT